MISNSVSNGNCQLLKFFILVFNLTANLQIPSPTICDAVTFSMDDSSASRAGNTNSMRCDQDSFT